jgi:hypothetical protein
MKDKQPGQVPRRGIINAVMPNVGIEPLRVQLMTAPGCGKWRDYNALKSFAIQKAADSKLAYTDGFKQIH